MNRNRSGQSDRFSAHHRFSHSQVREVAEVVASEHPGRRLLMNVTVGHRSQALRQAITASAIGVLTMLALYAVERAEPTIGPDELTSWAILMIVCSVLRLGFTYVLFAPTPAQVASSLLVRCLPLVVVTLTALQYWWCVNVFIGDTLTPHAFVLFCGFIGISVAISGMMSSAPLAAMLYLLTAWPPYLYQLFGVHGLPLAAWVALVLCIVLVLVTCAYNQVTQVNSILTRSDKVDLLLAELKKANIELTTANTSLAEMRTVATEELRSRSMFFSSASHDFKQRLHAMKLLSRAAIYEGVAANVSIAPLNRLADAVEDVEHYVTELLEFARHDSDSLTICKRTVVLQRVFQQLDVSFEDVAAESRVDLRIRPTDVVIRTDPVLLERVLQNLISNAIKFAASARVVVAARKRGGAVLIEVWDSGQGVSTDDVDKIFLPFYQGRNLRPGGGVGLGLAAVKRFVDSMGYSISVRSKLHHGTVMSVLIPSRDVIVS